MTRDYLFSLVFNPVRVAVSGQIRRKAAHPKAGARNKESCANEAPLRTSQDCPSIVPILLYKYQIQYVQKNIKETRR